MHFKHFSPILFIVVSASCVSSGSPETEKISKTFTVNKNDSFQSTNFHIQFLNQVNLARSEGRHCGQRFFPAAPQLSLNNVLNHAAYNHSNDMFEHQFLDHASSNGDTLVERMSSVDYSWRAVGENIAHNQNSIGQVIEDWLSSPGHCSNIMSADYTQTGVAQVNRYWTQVYATPK